MNPFYWYEGIPLKEGWYICAWEMGSKYIYDVGKWDGKEWFTHITAEPNLFHKIFDPHEFFAQLDAEAQAFERAQAENNVRQEKQETHDPFAFLGAHKN
jgi:hypothetical protein